MHELSTTYSCTKNHDIIVLVSLCAGAIICTGEFVIRAHSKELPMEKQTKDVRKPYASPEVKRWGTVSELTKVGLTNPGQDWVPGTGVQMFGSVYPPAGQ